MAQVSADDREGTRRVADLDLGDRGPVPPVEQDRPLQRPPCGAAQWQGDEAIQ